MSGRDCSAGNELARAQEALALHRASPEVSATEYFNRISRELAKEISSSIKIYLDSCYWVRLRDAQFGRAKSSADKEVLELIRALVESGRAICPVSDAAFIELMQQTDSESRSQTAFLMDTLSRGVCLRTEQERVFLQLQRFMAVPHESGRIDLNLSWVRPAFVLGVRLPHHAGVPRAVDHLLQKVTIDLGSRLSFAEIAQGGPVEGLADAMTRSANEVNSKLVEYASSITSFEQAFRAEISGAVKLYDADLARSFLTEKQMAITDENIEKFKASAQTLLFNLFRLRPELMVERLPTLFVHASCHAAIRWDKKRRLNGHDVVDIHHACAAAGYCDVMLTEKPLKALMTSGKLNLHKRLNLAIAANAAEAVEFIESAVQD
ncbi:hypothetical protein ACJ6WH_10200 [Stenotrophomonas maltophilia]|uniref:hypothetical protein n=1 Tax=Stenotrophomonas maltophilia TaxID=40324 RepID=UPI003896A7B2